MRGWVQRHGSQVGWTVRHLQAWLAHWVPNFQATAHPGCGALPPGAGPHKPLGLLGPPPGAAWRSGRRQRGRQPRGWLQGGRAQPSGTAGAGRAVSGQRRVGAPGGGARSWRGSSRELRAYQWQLAEMGRSSSCALKSDPRASSPPAAGGSPAAPGRGGAGTWGSVALAMTPGAILECASSAGRRPRGQFGFGFRRGGSGSATLRRGLLNSSYPEGGQEEPRQGARKASLHPCWRSVLASRQLPGESQAGIPSGVTVNVNRPANTAGNTNA